jgi:hypothetical protein
MYHLTTLMMSDMTAQNARIIKSWLSVGVPGIGGVDDTIRSPRANMMRAAHAAR